MRLQIDVQVWRGSIAESRHRLQLAACDADGHLRAATDAPSSVTTLRSAAKPFQLLPLVERGHAEQFGFSELELALMAASHTGSAAHLEVVRGILARVDCVESDLACGFHEPVDADALREMYQRGLPHSPLYNNCSGKHAGMLALCRAESWPTQGYERAEHPLQRLMHRTVAEMCGVAPERVASAVDGCSVCVFAVPLDAMARGFARLASARGNGDARDRALARIRRAMIAHPWAVGGKGRFSTALMEAAPDLVAKGGAEGLECAGWPAGGLGVAIKCEDGATRAVAPAMVLVLERLGVLPESSRAGLDEWRRPRMKNHAGVEVGELRAEVRVVANSAG